MSTDGYERYSWDTLDEDYDPTEKKYSGYDMHDAYEYGLSLYEDQKENELRIDQLEGLLSANVRVIKEELRKEMSSEIN